MIRKLIPIILIALTLGACGIKRDNPLDPYENGRIIVPGDVAGLHAGHVAGDELVGEGAREREVQDLLVDLLLERTRMRTVSHAAAAPPRDQA